MANVIVGYISRCMMSKIKHSQYEIIKHFIENDLHIELTFEQKQRLKYMLDDDIQKNLQELYKESDE